MVTQSADSYRCQYNHKRYYGQGVSRKREEHCVYCPEIQDYYC